MAEYGSDAYILDKVARAKLGDALSAAEAAIFMHVAGERSDEWNIPESYSQLLHRALRSSDAELLVCIGDELVSGMLLKRDLAMANEFYLRADRYSAYMGAYVLGKLYAKTKSDLSKRFFKKAAHNGHIPSLALYHELVIRSSPIIGFILRLGFTIADIFVIKRALKSGDLQQRFWRYRDLPIKATYAVLQVMDDRKRPFEDIKLKITQQA